MARPCCKRTIAGEPEAVLFKPAGVPAGQLEVRVVSLDEVEALRLADMEGLYHETAAARMGVSRATFGRIVAEARRKVAEALIAGHALRLHGGNVVIEEGDESMRNESVHEGGACQRRRRHLACEGNGEKTHAGGRRRRAHQGPCGGRGRRGGPEGRADHREEGVS